MEKVYIVTEKEMEELREFFNKIRHSVHVIEQNKSNSSVIEQEIENIDTQAIQGIYSISTNR